MTLNKFDEETKGSDQNFEKPGLGGATGIFRRSVARLDNFEEYFVVWTMALMTLLVFCQVVMRYVFRNSLSWSEELARFIFMWLSWIGASYAVKERSHFRVEMFANLMKGRRRIRFELLILVIWFAFAAIMTWLGTRLTIFLMEKRQISPAMEIPMSWVYASVPAGCGLMAVRLIVEIVKILKGPWTPNDDGLESVSPDEGGA
ncbi:MAG: TRAP transporter small permease [Synergistaceae bacterium]|jgi:TRAP-type C4-dicarboxylate transport system permease small subunit|nr:TRAP transporter small permease [Synergistaceae bacterium]